MKYFSWGLLKRYVGITHLIAFSFGVIVIFFLDALVFEKSIADWISSTANVVMAGAALYAALSAKDWFKQKTHSLGFEKTEILLIQLDTIYASINDDMDKMSLYHLNIKCNKDSDDKNDVHTLKDNIENKMNSLNKIKDNFNYLSRWNVKIINIEFISQILDKIESNLIFSSKAAFNLCSYHSSAVEDTYYRNYFIEGFQKHYTELEESIDELERLYIDFQRTPFYSMFSTR